METKEIFVWTYFKSAFQFGPGGRPRKALFDGRKVAELWGVELYEVKIGDLPRIVIGSGAIVGAYIDVVLNDMLKGGKEACLKQVEVSRNTANAATLITPAEFTDIYQLGKKE